MKKKICVTIALIALLACSMFSLVACDFGSDDNAEKLAYVSLDINPAIELIVDKDNKVVSVYGENEDGQVLLYEETGIVGEDIESAINKITDLAVKYGYLDENNKVVDTIVSSGDENFKSEILNKVNTTITATAANLGLTVTTDGEGAYSLLRKMEEVKKQFPNNAAIQNMSVSKFKLALSVADNGDISIEAAVDLDEAELVEMRKDLSAKLEEFATDSFKQAKATALAAYDQVTKLAGYGVYTKYYIDNLTSHFSTAYYGGVYQMYASAATGLSTICDIAELACKVQDYPLNESQIDAIVKALGMQSADELKNSNGEVTIASIEAYADKLFKNSPAAEKLEQTKVALTQALAQAENAIKSKLNELNEKYQPQIEVALENARNILSAVENMYNALPDALKSVIANCTKDLKDILAQVDTILATGKIGIDEVRTFAESLDTKAQEYLLKIKADLTEEEWQEVETMKTEAIEKCATQREQLEKTLDEAAKSAKEYLANLKSQRLA